MSEGSFCQAGPVCHERTVTGGRVANGRSVGEGLPRGPVAANHAQCTNSPTRHFVDPSAVRWIVRARALRSAHVRRAAVLLAFTLPQFLAAQNHLRYATTPLTVRHRAHENTRRSRTATDTSRPARPRGVEVFETARPGDHQFTRNALPIGIAAPDVSHACRKRIRRAGGGQPVLFELLDPSTSSASSPSTHPDTTGGACARGHKPRGRQHPAVRRTAGYDAVLESCRHRARAPGGAGVILISDGSDTASDARCLKSGRPVRGRLVYASRSTRPPAAITPRERERPARDHRERCPNGGGADFRETDDATARIARS